MEVLKTNRQRQAIAEATTCVVMEALKTDRETEKTGSNNLRGYGSTEDKQRNRHYGSNNLHGYGSIEDKQIEKQTLWEATTYTVMEVLMTNRETDYGSNNLHGYGSTDDKQRNRLWKQQPTRLWKY